MKKIFTPAAAVAIALVGFAGQNLLPATAQAQAKGKPAPKLAPLSPDAQAKLKAREAAKQTGVKPVLIEKITASPGNTVIPYEKYKLANGLTVIISEDHSDPIVHVDVTYHVGSAREEIGKSGFAHFFEHMMFQGSDNVGDEEHFKIVSESGGTLNGSTNRDRTNYFETLPKNQLERALWLEADRMGFLLDAVTTKKFENQRETVKNERGQNYDNRPYGLVSEVTAKNLYPYGHPYSWLTIGYIEDLNRVGVQDLKNFFLRWYGPNNATLTVGGDVTVAQVLTLAEKYFGPIKPGPAVTKTTVPAAVIPTDRYVSYEDAIRFPGLVVTYPTVPAYSDEEPALDCLAEIIGGGPNSLFYKNFVKKQIAVQARASHPTAELSGEFQFFILATPGHSLASVDSLLKATLKEFEARGVTEEDLQRYKATYESNVINGLATVNGKVVQLAEFQTLGGNANMTQRELDKRRNLTRADVLNAYNKYIKGKGAVILSVLPKGKNVAPAAPNNYAPDQSGYKAGPDQYKGLVYDKAKDSFDRHKKPAPGPNPTITVPPYWTSELPNGLKVIGTRSNEVPAVTLLLSIKGGHLLDANDLSKAGLARLTADMLDESTEKYTTEAISSELEKLGSSIEINAGEDAINISVNSLTKNLDATLALLDQKLRHPKFDAEDFNRLKEQLLQSIANRPNQPVAVANLVYSKLLYGEGNVLGTPVSGTEASVKTITLDDVKGFWSKYISPSVTNLVVVGDIDEATALSKLGALKSWPAKAVTVPVPGAALPIDKTTIFLVDKEKAAQSEVRIGYVAIPYDATGDYYKAGLMNYILGGAFNSRINLNLREDKGWTYGARSSFDGSEYAGPFTASGGIKRNATDSSITEFMKEIKNYRDKGITPDELEFLKNSIGQSEARKYESPGQKASFLNRIVRYKLDKGFIDAQNKILKDFSAADVTNYAKKLLPYEKMDIVIVGDRALVEPGLRKLGYPVVLIDKEGNRVQETPSAPVPASIPAVPATPAKPEKNKKG